nr:kinase [Peribacillus kribbensis]
MQIKELIESIHRLHKSGRTIIGIDGLSRSGKSTLACRLVWELQDVPVVLLHIDDYIQQREKRYNTSREPWFEYYGLQWDVEGLRNDLFEKLKKEDKLSLFKYDGENDSLVEQTIQLPDQGVILIEGVFLQREEWKSFFDFIVFLKSDRDTRFARESTDAQGDMQKFETRYWKAEDYYIREVEPEKNAGLVLEN